VKPRTKQVGAVLCLIAMAFFAGWPFWKWVYCRPASASVHERTQRVVDANPQLKPAWEVATEDGVLTLPEAKIIVEAAGEKIEVEAAR
jgi:hypothetical protein